jgi:predicted enzyme related to lactoylglutathione lyase
MSTTTTKHAQGTFCWPELGTTDLAGARAFYTGLFGWAVQEIPMGEGQLYVIFKSNGKDCGAAYTLMKQHTDMGVPPNWGAYIAVDDCDAAVERVKRAGGQVLEGPMDVMGTLGRMAACMDPQGAVFSVWQAKDHIGIGVMDEPGALCWTELMTNDTARAKAFYTGVVGWTTQAMPMGPMEYTLCRKSDGANAAGMMQITPEMGPVPPHWMSYFQVSDIAATVAKATGLGAKTTVPVQEVPGVGHFAILQDPQGAYFALLQPTM